MQGIIAAVYFEEGPTREIIHNFKYNSVTELKDTLGELLYYSLKKNNLEADIITFAPLHPRRLAQRGYNQAEILAQELSKRSHLPCCPLLIKNKSTKRQVQLNSVKRRINLQGVFKINKNLQKSDIKNKKIIIVDDITTTGTTLNECARVLKDNQAKEVWGLVIARG